MYNEQLKIQGRKAISEPFAFANPTLRAADGPMPSIEAVDQPDGFAS